MHENYVFLLYERLIFDEVLVTQDFNFPWDSNYVFYCDITVTGTKILVRTLLQRFGA